MGTEIDYTSGKAVAERNGAGASVEVAKARGVQEIQAMVIMAKEYGRNEVQSFSRIMGACQRKRLADASQYAYPRGDKIVTGPSIRLAEVLAQNWGNVDFGIVELEQRNGESQVMAYCWDLETNVRQAKVFTVPHERHTKRGVTKLTDPRDIYELVANQGARRLRACILGIIPGDVVESAVEACNKTLAGSTAEPIADRVRKMVVYFQQTFGVSQEQIEGRLGHKIEATIETELVTLKQIATSLKDGMAKPSDFFEYEQRGAAEKTTAADLGFADDKKPVKPKKDAEKEAPKDSGEAATPEQIEYFEQLEIELEPLVLKATDGRTDDIRALTKVEADALRKMVG